MPKIIYEFESQEEVDKWVQELIKRNETLDPPTRWTQIPSEMLYDFCVPCTFS